MTLPGQPSGKVHVQEFSDFASGDRMPSFSQFQPQQAAKDFIPPDPLQMRPGMYIPPEETAALSPMNPSLDDVMGWSQSDDEQQDTDEDEEDNEFDMEFDDPEGMALPPMQATLNPMICERHMSQPNFSVLESAPYTPRPLGALAYPVMTRYEYEQQPGYKAPFNFIDPSSLQLKSPNGSYTTAHSPIMPELDSRDNLIELEEPAPSSEPMVTEALDYSNDKALGDMGIGLDVDMDFVFDDSRAESEPLEPFAAPGLVSPRHSPTLGLAKNTPEPKIEQQRPQELPSPTTKTPTAPPSQTPKEVAELRTPPMSTNELSTPVTMSESPVSQFMKSNQDDEDDDSRSFTLSPPPEKPRKRTTRRAPKSGVASHHGGSHVCNMAFADGRECHRSFTRPYDLARHQETIHAPVRRTYKCDVCGERSKTFSRLDALSRHVRLKHSA